MKEICEESGIQLNTSVRYGPKSNGVAERTIRVLTSAVWAMLHDSGFPKLLWAEAGSAATYVHKSISVRLGHRAPSSSRNDRRSKDVFFRWVQVQWGWL